MIITKLERYTFASNLKMRTMSETIMVYNPENGDMYEMNDTAAILIEYLGQGLSGKRILEKICEEYDVEAETVIEDLDYMLNRLCEVGVLKLEN